MKLFLVKIFGCMVSSLIAKIIIINSTSVSYRYVMVAIDMKETL